MDHPLSHLLLFGGDINRVASNNGRFYIDPLRHAEYLSNNSVHTNNLHSDQKEWDRALSLITELDTNTFSHYSSAE
eukprot:2229720-Karenia_brevis.AAC.1